VRLLPRDRAADARFPRLRKGLRARPEREGGLISAASLPEGVAMQANPAVITRLNAQLRNELSAIDPCFLHASTLRHRGLVQLGKHEYEESIEEMKHADKLVERMAQQTLKAGIAHCESVQEYVSREALVDILDDTEEHVDWLETQIAQIDQVTLPNCLRSAMASPS
jgi:bacterioferritin